MIIEHWKCPECGHEEAQPERTSLERCSIDHWQTCYCGTHMEKSGACNVPDDPAFLNEQTVQD